MIKNSDAFYTRAKEYQGKRAAIVDAYEKRMEALEDARGSKYFTDEAKKAEDTRDEALTALKGEYAGYFNTHLDAMSKTNGSRGMVPPTEEELRTLQLLKMKDKVTERELEAAANTLKGNATCLSILGEIAHKNGVMRSFSRYSTSNEMTVEDVEDGIKGLRAAITDFMDHDTPRAARIVKERNERLYGATPDAPPLRKRALFDDKEGCFRTLAGGLTGDTLTAFCNAVDGE